MELTGFWPATRRDPLLWLTAAAYSVLLVLHLLGSPPRPSQLLGEDLASALVAGLAMAAALRGTGRMACIEERRFWRLLAAGFGFWMAEQALDMFVPDSSQVGLRRLTSDGLYLLMYLTLLLAFNEAPHRRVGWSERAPGRRLEGAAAAICVTGVLAYFVVATWIGSRSDERTAYDFVYVALDLLLCAQTLLALREAPRRPWRRTYFLLLVTFALWAENDYAVVRNPPNGPSADSDLLYSFLWYLSPLLTILAARWRDLGARTAEAEDAHAGPEATPLFVPIMLYAFALPIGHLLVEALQLAGPASLRARAVLTLGFFFALASVALVYYSRLERHTRHLALDLARTQQELLEARTLEAVGRLAGGVAHEFNNLLAVILGRVEQLLERLPQGSRESRGALDIRKAAERAATLTSELLAYARRQILAEQVLDLDEVAGAAHARLAPGGDARVAFDRVLGLAGHVRADPAQIDRVIDSLVANARESTPPGGHIRIETERLDVPATVESRPQGPPPGRYAVLSVRDDGQGMDAATRARIFEPFFTTKEFGRGVGLGLSSVYGIVRQSGGYLLVESDPGRGSVFRVVLPRVEPTDGSLPQRTA